MSLVKFRNRPSQPSFFDMFFDDFLNKNINETNGFGLTASTPKANIRETENEYAIELAAPGYNKDNFNVEVDNGQLTLSVERTHEENEDQENFKHREFRYEGFSRSFMLPEDVDEDKIKAKYNDGILKVEIPRDQKKLQESRKKIKVG